MSGEEIDTLAAELCSRMSSAQRARIGALDPAAIPIAVPDGQSWTEEELDLLRRALHRAARQRRPKAG